MRTANQLAARNTPRITGIDAASPGHSVPMPSPNQNTPNDESIAPTPNFIQFSGTAVSGCRSAAATAVTMTPAATATQIAAAMAETPFAPNEMTMKATSGPSRSTALYATIIPLQSHSVFVTPCDGSW